MRHICHMLGALSHYQELDMRGEETLMQSTTRRLVPAPAVQQIRQGWVLLSLLALLTLLVLVGAGMSRVHSATGSQLATTNGDIHIGGMVAPSGGQIAATNGEILIGSTMASPLGGQLATTNGNVHIGGVVAPLGGQIAASVGDVHIGS